MTVAPRAPSSPQWRDGEREGVGTFLYANGAKYVGEWSANLKAGHGIFTFEDGSVYEASRDDVVMTVWHKDRE